MSHKKQKKNIQEKGFSLVEFVVVISIFAIMTSVSMFNYGEQRITIESNNLAQDVALTIRQAQVYGISASARNIGGTDFGVEEASDFFENQIIDVTKDRSIRGVAFILEKNTIILYEDVDRNHLYTKDKDIIIDTRKIASPQVAFQEFVLVDSNGTEELDDGVVDISFERPYPDATIYWRENVNTLAHKSFTKVDIYIGGKVGVSRYVTVNSIGNITVKIKE